MAKSPKSNGAQGPTDTGRQDGDVIEQVLVEDAPAADLPDRTATSKARRASDRTDDSAAESSGLQWGGADDRRREIAEAVRRQRHGEADETTNPDDDEGTPDEAVIVRSAKEDEQVEEATDVDADAPPVAEKAKPSLAKPVEKTAKEEMARAARKVGLDELDDDVTLEITVNGKTVETTVGDLLANAGKYMAGDEHLENAKEILRSARVRPTEIPDDARDEQRQPSRPPDGSRPLVATPAIDKDRLRTIVDTIQGGTVDEAAEALAEVLAETNRVATQAAEGVSARDRDENRVRSVVNDALNAVAKRYPEIDGDVRLVREAAVEVNESMKKALRAIDIAEADQLDAMTPMELIRSYTLFRDNNPDYRGDLPDVHRLFDDAAAATYEWRFGEKKVFEDDGQSQPAETPRVNGNGHVRQEPRAAPSEGPVRRTGVRVVRKETLSVQPRPASIRADSAEKPSVSRETRQEAAVEKMRAERQGVPLARR